MKKKIHSTRKEKKFECRKKIMLKLFAKLALKTQYGIAGALLLFNEQRIVAK